AQYDADRGAVREFIETCFVDDENDRVGVSLGETVLVKVDTADFQDEPLTVDIERGVTAQFYLDAGAALDHRRVFELPKRRNCRVLYSRHRRERPWMLDRVPRRQNHNHRDRAVPRPRLPHRNSQASLRRWLRAIAAFATSAFSDSEAHALEETLGNEPDDRHDGTPEPRHVYHVSLALPRCIDAGCGGFRSHHEQTVAAPGHAGVDGAELHRHDLNARASEPAAKSLRKSRQRAFRGTVDVVFRSATFPRDRADRDDEPAVLLLEMSRGQREQAHGAVEVLVQCRQRRVRFNLGGAFFAEGAEAYDHAVEIAEFRDRAVDYRRVR